jgi:cysteine desulfurase
MATQSAPLRGAINLDSNASYPMHPRVRAILSCPQHELLNPSSVHQGGQAARISLETTRDLLRQAFQASDATIAFTSGATEGNNAVLFSPFWSYLNTHREQGIIPELVISAVEHPAVFEAAKKLESLGVKLHIVSPRACGNFYPSDFADCITDRTKLISVMAVNNETGLRLPIEAIFHEARVKNPRILCHTDAVQLFGKESLSLTALGADYVTVSAHKIGGIAGVGAIIMRQGSAIDALVVGGPQETGRRAGTENVLGIIAFGEAVAALIDEGTSRAATMREHRELLVSLLNASIPEAVIHFQSLPSIGNTVSVRFPGSQTSDMVVALDLHGVYASSGSACSSGKVSASPVLLAHGFSEEEALQTVRLSVHHHLTKDDIHDAVYRIKTAYNTMQRRRAA